MMSKIDNRVLLAFALIVGLLGGYFINGLLISGPQIDSLLDTNEAQESQIDDLVLSKNVLQEELSTLQDDYDELEVSTTQEITGLESEISNLEDEARSQQIFLDLKESALEDMQDLVNELSYNNTVLEDQLAELYNPLVSEFRINSLLFKVSVNDDKYPDNIPIEGTVEISYLDGDKFEGTFKLEVIKVYISAGSSSPNFEIDGLTKYKWTGAFALGPGSYKLGLSDVKDSNGVPVVSNSQLKNYPLYIFMG